MEGRIDHASAIITGAAQGIGRRTAELFASAGYSLALLDLRSCVSTLAAAGAHGCDAEEFIGDISDEQTVNRIIDGVRDRWQQVDVLVNNAGISFIAPAEDLDAQAFRRVLEVNLAPFLLSKAVGKLMLERGSGSIVNVASIAGLMGICWQSLRMQHR